MLVAKGLIRLGEGPLDDEFWSLPAHEYPPRPCSALSAKNAMRTKQTKRAAAGTAFWDTGL